MPKQHLQARARYATAVQHHGHDSDEAAAARAALAEANITEQIRKLVDAAPPLTAAQKAELRVLLEPARRYIAEHPDTDDAAAS